MNTTSKDQRLAAAKEKLKKYQKKMASGTSPQPGNQSVLVPTINQSVLVPTITDETMAEGNGNHEFNLVENHEFNLVERNSAAEASLNASSDQPSHQQYHNHGYQQESYQQESYQEESYQQESYPPEQQQGQESYPPEQQQEQESYPPEQQPEYTAWEYQEYINQILYELESVKGELEIAKQSSSSTAKPSVVIYDAQIDNVQEENRQLLITLEQSQDALMASQEKCRGLEHENRALCQQTNHMQNQHVTLQDDVERYTNQIKSLEKDVAHYKEMSESFKKQVGGKVDSSKKIAELQVQLEGSRDENKALESQINALTLQAQEQEGAWAGVNERMQQLQNQSTKTKTELEAKLKKAETQLIETMDKLEQALKQSSIQQKVIDSLRSEIEKMSTSNESPAKPSPTSNVSNLSNQILQLTDRCHVLQDENQKLIGGLEELRQRNVMLTNEKLELVERVGHMESTMKNSALQSGADIPTTSPGVQPPIPYPSTSAKPRKSSDHRLHPKPEQFTNESDILNQVSTLTAKLLELELQNKALHEDRLRVESLRLPSVIAHLETQNGQLKNELEKERKVTVLLQAEVDALPDMIEKYHQERKALLLRVNKQAFDSSIREKESGSGVNQVKESNDRTVYISCKSCAPQKLLHL